MKWFLYLMAVVCLAAAYSVTYDKVPVATVKSIEIGCLLVFAGIYAFLAQHLDENHKK